MTGPADCWLCQGLGAVAIHDKATVGFGRPLWVAHQPESRTHETKPCPACSVAALVVGLRAAPLAVHSPSDDCNCEPLGMERCAYRLIADRIIGLLNPPDGEEAEVSICLAAVECIAAYVRSLPCTCLPGAADREVDPCGRCDVLGMAANRAEER